MSDPISPNANGIYGQETISFASDIDSGVTGLFATCTWDTGCAAAGPLDLVGLGHGFSGAPADFRDVDAQRWAARGGLVLRLGKRGDSPATGSKDAGGRETYDHYQAFAAARAHFAFASTTRAHMVGYSGGGANALSLFTKSDLIAGCGAFFPIDDYAGWYRFNAAAPSLLIAAIGGSPVDVPQAYRARMRTEALAQTLLYGGLLRLLADVGDITVSVRQSDSIDASLNAASLGSRYSYTRTASGSTYRAFHGNPVDFPSDLIPLEYDLAAAIFPAPLVAIPTRGKLFVPGFYVSKTQNFEVWLDHPDASGNPRTNGTGGTRACAFFVYDVPSGTWKIHPCGAVKYYVRMGAVESTGVAFARSGRKAI